MPDAKTTIAAMGAASRAASRMLAYSSTAERNAALTAMAGLLESKADAIRKANRRDLAAARKAGLDSHMLDRLELNDKRIADMVRGIREVIALPDPVGRVLWERTRPSGLRIRKVTVPIGAIGIIYEARPNVTADAAALCIKAGNSVMLKGGKEAIRSNLAIAGLLREALRGAGLDENGVQVVASTARSATRHMVRLEGTLDLLMPRGGEGLIRFVTDNATVPVIKHYKGVCAIYADKRCDLDMAVKLIVNAKAQRPAVCNAIENLFIHKDIAAALAAKLVPAFSRHRIEPICDAAALKLFPGSRPATAADWTTEYLDLRLTVGIVDSLDEAVDKINIYGSAHSDAIVTSDPAAAAAFLLKVDSAAVYHNTSTRFTDGAEFGLGAEIGISTDKLHARGPMGLEELTSYKYLVVSEGVVRE
ncbi:MAG: glutamate-5-semialdehyde dehydrogenase [Planctomycetota bacterium]